MSRGPKLKRRPEVHRLQQEITVILEREGLTLKEVGERMGYKSHTMAAQCLRANVLLSTLLKFGDAVGYSLVWEKDE